eukprot:scaffold234672_cov29-Tisochrysis_lutea.AAC.5
MVGDRPPHPDTQDGRQQASKMRRGRQSELRLGPLSKLRSLSIASMVFRIAEDALKTSSMKRSSASGANPAVARRNSSASSAARERGPKS